MANASGVFGLRPTRYIDGTPWNGEVFEAYVSSSYATALFVGDPVLLTPTLAEKDTTGTKLTINKSAGTDGIIVFGVITGFAPDPDNLSRIYNPASTERVAYVVRAASDLLFEIRGDGGGTPTKVVPGQNAVMIASSSGDTNSGMSGMALDEGTTTAPSANQSNPLFIWGIKEKADNELGTSALYEVLINTNDNATGRILGVTAA